MKQFFITCAILLFYPIFGVLLPSWWLLVCVLQWAAFIVLSPFYAIAIAFAFAFSKNTDLKTLFYTHLSILEIQNRKKS